MAKINLPYLFVVTSKGQEYPYYRRNGARHGLPRPIGSPAFLETYERIHRQYESPPQPRDAAPGTLAHIVRLYRQSAEYRQLGTATRKDYDRYITILTDGDPDKGLGPLRDFALATLDWPFIKRVRELYADTPRKAEFIRQMFSILCEVAIEEGFRKDNPTKGRKRLKGGDGHRPWEESEITQFQQFWSAVGPERVAFELALNSGQRRGDVIAMSRSHYREGKISVVQEKTRNRVWIPASSALRAILDPFIAGHSQMVLLVNQAGRPFEKTAFSKFFRSAVTQARLPPDLTMHGLRYTAATRVYELMIAEGQPDEMAWDFVASITGHETAAMARKYSSKKRRAAFAIQRIDKISE